jgi:hypothetical protein
MRRYRRANAGAAYFFTVNLANRKLDMLMTHIERLRSFQAIGPPCLSVLSLPLIFSYSGGWAKSAKARA